MLVEERREKVINTITHLSEDKLAIVENLLKKIDTSNNANIEKIYEKAVEKYHNTLQKLAQ